MIRRGYINIEIPNSYQCFFFTEMLNIFYSLINDILVMKVYFIFMLGRQNLFVTQNVLELC